MKRRESVGVIRTIGASIAGVALTNPECVLYPDQGITKLELAEFYRTIADRILPHIVDRPLVLVRCPKGQEAQCFYQKHLDDSLPSQLRGVAIAEKTAKHTYVVVDDLPGLIALVQMSVLELHPWPARADKLERPDRLVFDLDPGDGVPWTAVVDAALDVRKRLEQCGLESFVRTSGGKGLHVVAPVSRRTDWETFKRFAKAVAVAMSVAQPDRYLATASKAHRRGKVFIDYLRNQRGATAVASYSTRARVGAPVATPVRWNELDGRLAPDKYTVRNLKKRLAAMTRDPWDGFFDVNQSISKAALRSLER